MLRLVYHQIISYNQVTSVLTWILQNNLYLNAFLIYFITYISDIKIIVSHISFTERKFFQFMYFFFKKTYHQVTYLIFPNL